MEVECSVIGNGEPLASQPGEIVLVDADWYDYEAKYTPGRDGADRPRSVCRPRSASACASWRSQTFRTTGCCGLARVDFFIEGERVLVNELNTIPGFTETSVFGALFAASGIPYPELLDRLVRWPRALRRRAPPQALSGRLSGRGRSR